MLKKTLTYLILLTFITAFSQNENKIHLKSINFGLGVYKDQYRSLNYGIGGNTEIATNINSTIIAINVAYGFGLIKKNEKHLFHMLWDFDLLYGREFKISNKVIIEGQTGIGYIIQTHLFNEDQNAFAIPIKLKVKFITSKKTNIGISPSINYNNINSIYSLNLFIEHNFKKKGSL